jgi:hypothetical protein
LYTFTHLSASSDSELLKCPDIIYEQVHQPQLVTETYQDVEAARVQSDAVGLLSKLLVKFKVTAMYQIKHV